MRSLVVIPVLAALAAACGGAEPGRVPEPPGPVEVTVSTAGSAPASMDFPARVAARDEVELATRASGTVRQVTVDVGSRVRPGELLVALESGDAGAGVAAAEAGLRQASRYHDRIAALAKDGAATPQELDDAEARLAMARAGLQQARTQMGYVRLSAPIAGVVTERRVDPGDLVVPGQPALEIVSTDGLKVVADLPAERAGLLSPGDDVTVSVPGDGPTLPARVTRVVPALEGGSRRFRVEAAFDGPVGGLLPGAFVRLEVARPGDATRWAPADAIVRRGQLTGVFTVEKDTLRLRWIRPGREREGAVEVLAGLPDGARVVRRPEPGLADGQPVRAASDETWRIRPLAEAAGKAP